MTMPTRTLGDLTVSVIGLGCNNFGRDGFATEGIDGTRAVLDACAEHGVTLLDTAAIYGRPDSRSEKLMGEALAGRRDAFVIATKFGHSGGPEPAEWGARGSRDFVRRACEASLGRLRIETIDLFQLHEPDDATPIDETLGALAELRAEGKIREYGLSNVTADQVRAAADATAASGLHPVASVQNEFSLLRRDAEADVIPALRERGIGLLPYFPLASCLLTGKYAGRRAPEGSRLAHNQQRFAEITDAEWSALDAYQALCAELGRPMTEVSFAWLLHHDVVPSVIAGATSPEQVAANAAAGSATLTDAEVARIDALFAA